MKKQKKPKKAKISGPVLPLAPLERVARRAGAERVSSGAVEELRDAVEEVGFDIAKDVVKVSKHAGRKTVKPEDVTVVVK